MKISRRNFLKLGFTGIVSAALYKKRNAYGYLPQFPEAPRLGRVFAKVDLLETPDPASTITSTLYDDAVVILEKEIIAKPYNEFWKKRSWYKTPDGYIPAISVQPVRNEPNVPLKELPKFGINPGMWAEITVPFADIKLDGDVPFSPRLKETLKPRFYYSQVLWIDQIRENSDGQVEYHAIERYGNVDTFWVDAKAFKPIAPDEVSIISPGSIDKYILVDLNHQTISCFENGNEILFARISSGAKYDYLGNYVEKWGTPVNDYHAVNRKYISLHMAGGEEGKASGYEEFAVPWTSIFASGGVAIHSTYWHNNFGERLSHGCVNVEPDVAKFIFRWTLPETPYDPGNIEVLGYDGTNVKVQEA